MTSAAIAIGVGVFREVRLDECCTFMSGGTPSKGEPENWRGAIPWASPKDLKTPRLFDTQDHISEEGLRSGSTLAPANSVFVVVRGMILVKDIPVTQAAVPMAFNQDLKAIVPGADLVPDFLPFAIAARKAHLRERLGRSAHGTRSLLSEDIATLEIPLPEWDEQRRIAAILWKVQRAIEVQEQLIATVRELKQAAMRQLFTRGLRGEAQKETEIGMVPASWDVLPLGRLVDLLGGRTPSKSRADFWHGITPWASPKDMKRAVLSDTIDHISNEALETGGRLSPIGSVLVVVRGMILAHDVPVALVAREMAFNQDIKALVCREGLLPIFLLYRLQSLRLTLLGKVLRSAHGTGTLSTDALKGVLLAIPTTLTEQHEIATALQTIDRKLAHHERKRDTLHELFKTLLHELMTGRIRVHELDVDITALAGEPTGGEAT